VPQPVNQTEPTKTAHFTQVQDLRMCFSFKFATSNWPQYPIALHSLDLDHPLNKHALI
jgi:hypothetical protein